MNKKLACLFARRSVRKYENKAVPEDAVRDLLEAAMAAPSAAAKDPWHFIVVRDRAVLDRMAEGLPNGQMLRQAPLGLVVCGDLSRAHGGEESYLLQDCSAAIQNVLLAASMLGLGACWLGVHPRKERMAHMRSVFSLPDSVVPVSAIALGWPSEKTSPRTRYRAEAVHEGKW